MRAEGGRAGRRRRNRWPLLIAVAGTAGLLALFVSTRRPAVIRPVAGGFAAGAESLNAATRRHDWSGAEQWAERLAVEQPRNFDVLYTLALSHHNRTTAMTPRFNRPRPALRLSLERIAAEIRVLALLDSAARLATAPEEWARAQLLRGMAFEGLGLPIEALGAYRAANERAPKLEAAGRRMRWVSAHLLDPLLPDALIDETPAQAPAPARAGPDSSAAPAPPRPASGDSVPK
jgi:hypothetical protein